MVDVTISGAVTPNRATSDGLIVAHGTRSGELFVADFIQGLIMEGRGFGIFGNIIVGVVGAFLAGMIFPALGFSVGGGFISSIIHATIGSVILLFIIGLIRRT